MSDLTRIRITVLTGLLIALCFETVNGLQCYRCMSTNSTRPFLCNEFFTHADEIEPDSCDNIEGAKYCIKRVGRFEGGVGTKRDCSAVDLGNYCDYVQQPGDKLEYRSCVYTCNSDGCNPASVVSPSGILNGVVISFAFILLRYR